MVGQSGDSADGGWTAPGPSGTVMTEPKLSTLPGTAMPKQAFIARQDAASVPSGVPIPQAEWLAALRAVPGLTVEEAANSEGQPGHTVQLPSGASAHLSLAASGMIAVDNPGRDLMEVLFSVAPTLNAGLYSAQLRPYQTLRDWERRNGRHPSQPSHAAQPAPPRRRRSRRWRLHFTRRKAAFAALWVGIVALSLLLAMRAGG